MIKLSNLELGDISDALETAKEGDCIDQDANISDFSIKRKNMKLSEILNYDDYSSWGQWSKGELARLTKKELYDELKSFRGIKWANLVEKWIASEKIPPIVIFPEIGLIGDGRGRVSLAVGLNIPKLEVILLN